MSNEYRKLPVIVEAVQWNGTNVAEVEELLGGLNNGCVSGVHSPVLVHTLQGPLLVDVGSWIVKDVTGDFVSWSPQAFHLMHETVEDREPIRV